MALSYVITYIASYVLTFIDDVATLPEALWGGLTDIMSQVVDFFVSLFEGVAKVFYNSTTGTLTVVGWLLIIGIAVTLFGVGLRFITRLINRMKAR